MSSEVEIRRFSDDLADAFKTLNLEWLEKYFTVEPLDEQLLSDPRSSIIRGGGEIFFALRRNIAVGTCALIAVDEQTFELGKMAVTASEQGSGLGKQLMEHAIDFSRAAGKKRIILFSNTALTPAIRLYRRFGFVEIPIEGSHYARTNIKMEKLL